MDESLQNGEGSERGMGSRACAGPLTGGDKPSKGHCRYDHDEQALRVIRHISFRQFYAYGKKTSCEDDTHDLPCKEVRHVSPRTRFKYTEDMGSQKNSKACSEDDFIHVQLFTTVSNLEEVY